MISPILGRLCRLESIHTKHEQLGQIVQDLIIEKYDEGKRKLRYPKEFRADSPCKGKSNDVTIVHAHNGPRELTPLGMPLLKAFKDLSSKGIMKPLDLGRYTPNISSPTCFANEYCEYHQSKGHHMDKFARLRYDVEDLIESKKITKPHIGKNSLLECHVVPPPNWG